MHHIFNRVAGGLEGICNGIDTQEWSPFCDKYLDVKYDANTIEEGKAIAKETLQAELGLEVSPYLIAPYSLALSLAILLGDILY